MSALPRERLPSLTTVYTWLILAFGEPLKTIDLSAMLLPKKGAGGGA